MNTNAAAGSASLTRPLILFLAINLLVIILAQAAAIMFNFTLPSATGIIILMAALPAAMQSFVKSEGRVPSKGERVRFASLGAIGVLAVSAIPIIGLMLYYGLSLEEFLGLGPITPMMTTIVLGISLLVSWVLIYFGSSIFAKQQAKLLAKV
jgi:hypothetical protein